MMRLSSRRRNGMTEWVEVREQELSPGLAACAYSRARGDKFGRERKGRGV